MKWIEKGRIVLCWRGSERVWIHIYRVKGEGSVVRKLRDKWWESTKSEGGVGFDLVHVWKEWWWDEKKEEVDYKRLFLHLLFDAMPPCKLQYSREFPSVLLWSLVMVILCYTFRVLLFIFKKTESSNLQLLLASWPKKYLLTNTDLKSIYIQRFIWDGQVLDEYEWEMLTI